MYRVRTTIFGIAFYSVFIRELHANFSNDVLFHKSVVTAVDQPSTTTTYRTSATSDVARPLEVGGQNNDVIATTRRNSLSASNSAVCNWC